MTNKPLLATAMSPQIDSESSAPPPELKRKISLSTRMKIQTITNVLVIVALAANTAILFRLGGEIREANQRVTEVEGVLEDAKELTRVTTEFLQAVSKGKLEVDDETKDKWRRKAGNELKKLLEDL